MSLEETLKKVYDQFFQTMEIDPETGCLGKHSGKKFPTYPYIGSKYGCARKVLFIGMDIGEDPKPGRIQSFSERRKSIEDKLLSKHNPHIAGTYMTTLYFLRDELDWNAHWSKVKGAHTCQQALKYQCGDLPLDNPLSYCALTNYYKFVEEDRTRRTGSKDRRYLDEDAERRFFNTELNAFNPDIIVFQGAVPNRAITNLNEMRARSCLAPHPSYRKKNGRIPENYVNRIEFLD